MDLAKALTAHPPLRFHQHQTQTQSLIILLSQRERGRRNPQRGNGKAQRGPGRTPKSRWANRGRQRTASPRGPGSPLGTARKRGTRGRSAAPRGVSPAARSCCGAPRSPGQGDGRCCPSPAGGQGPAGGDEGWGTVIIVPFCFAKGPGSGGVGDPQEQLQPRQPPRSAPSEHPRPRQRQTAAMPNGGGLAGAKGDGDRHTGTCQG